MKKKNVVIAGIASLVVIAASAFLIIKKRKSKGETAPANAPQLDIDNPGEQSEFLAGPTSEEGLG